MNVLVADTFLEKADELPASRRKALAGFIDHLRAMSVTQLLAWRHTRRQDEGIYVLRHDVLRVFATLNKEPLENASLVLLDVTIVPR